MIAAKIAAGLAALSLAACATQAAPAPSDPAQPPPHSPSTGATCDSTRIQQFVGQQRSDALEQAILQASGAALVRWVPAGTAASMVFRSDRVTAFLDAQNTIDRISCS